MSDARGERIIPASSAPVEASRASRALLGAATALVALHVTVTILRDLPLWDEANYLAWGRRSLMEGAPLSLAQSPAYALFLGGLSRVLGPVGALRVAAIGGAVAFGAAAGTLAFVAWRTSAARWLATALALGSAHAFSGIGVQRASITLLLLGAAALSHRRRALGVAAFLLCAAGAYLVRPEAAWAVPFLPLAVWRLAPGSRPDSRTERLAFLAGLTGLVIAGTVHAAHGGAARNWLAFQQHYALYRQPQLSALLGSSFSPWLDFETVMAIDFPGARSPLGALSVAPGRVVRFLLANAKAAATLASGSMVAYRRAAPIVLAIAAAIGGLSVVTRARTAAEWRRFGWLLVAMSATSAMAVEVVSDARHVIGLGVALAFGLGLLASRSLAGGRARGVVAVAVAGVSLAFACARSYDEVRGAAALHRPAAHMIDAVRQASSGRPVGVAGMCNTCICAYASSCTEIGPAQGYTTANQCSLLDGTADIVALRIDPGAAGAAPCRATGYRLLGRWPAIGMEVWSRGERPPE